MQHDDASVAQKAVERTTNPRATTRSQLEQTIAKRARVGQAELGPCSISNSVRRGVISNYVNWPRLHLGEDPSVVVLDFKRHVWELANMLTIRSGHGEGNTSTRRQSPATGSAGWRAECCVATGRVRRPGTVSGVSTWQPPKLKKAYPSEKPAPRRSKNNCRA